MRLRLLILIALCAAFLVGAPVALADTARTYYVSLGDSLAASEQPDGDFTRGYAEQLHAQLSAGEPKLRLVKLGCPGESTTSMLNGSQVPSVAASCGPPAFYTHTYPHKTQLAEAVAFLNAHRGLVRLVTIDIGGNDLLGPGGVGEIAENLPVILRHLNEAAGPGVPIIGMNYYDPFLALVWQASHDPAALQAEVDQWVSFNDLLEGFYQSAGDPVADVETAFQVTDTTPLADGTPRNVQRACQWTWICAPPPLGPDIHANTDGYTAIAHAFAVALQNVTSEPKQEVAR
jgi:lysophospholipase L1-like esterase